jgi:hypothetical protein
VPSASSSATLIHASRSFPPAWTRGSANKCRIDANSGSFLEAGGVRSTRARLARPVQRRARWIGQRVRAGGMKWCPPLVTLVDRAFGWYGLRMFATPTSSDNSPQLGPLRTDPGGDSAPPGSWRSSQTMRHGNRRAECSNRRESGERWSAGRHPQIDWTAAGSHEHGARSVESVSYLDQPVPFLEGECA